MKKIIVGALTFFMTLLIILVVVAQTLPNDYAMSATEIINASPNAIYANIVNFRKWESWSPWKQADPTMSFQFSKNTNASVPGDWLAWDSKKDGPGKITVTDVETDNLFLYKMEMPGMSESRGGFSLSKTDGRTALTWSLKGSRSFKEKIFWRFFGIEGKIQTKLNNGLNNIKNISEKK